MNWFYSRTSWRLSHPILVGILMRRCDYNWKMEDVWDRSTTLNPTQTCCFMYRLPLHQHSKHITFLISPLAGWTGFHDRNSRHLTQMMSDVHVNSKASLVSLIHYLCVNNPMWYIASPAAVARSTFGQTRWTLEVRVNKHQDTYKNRMTETSAMIEKAWENYHPMYWEETVVPEHDKG